MTRARIHRSPQPQPKQKRPASLQSRRRGLIIGLVVAAVAATASAFYRQVIETGFLTDQGERRYVRVREIPARRGMVVDRNGEPLAVTTPVTTLFANPRELNKRPEVIAPLARALELDPAELRQRLQRYSRKSFMYLKRRVHPDQVASVDELVERLDVIGIGHEKEYKRYYPSGEMFGHVIGFTDFEDRGQEGIELAYNKWLSASPGKRRVLQNGLRHVVAEIEQVAAPRHGKDLALSLDRRLQFIAYRELKRAVRKHKAVSGSAVLLDVGSGEILAMVNQPAYNPNGKLSGDASERRNRALTDVFEPGSTVKPFVVAMALEKGLVGPHTPVNTAPGTLRIGRYLVRDTHNHGLLDVTGIITKSSNVGVVKLARRMSKESLWKLYGDLGFGTPAGTGFPGERSGVLSNFKGWSSFEHATLAFGYGVSVTTLQLAKAYAVLAADGVARPVSLIAHQPAGEETRVLSERTARAVRAMMETVVSKKGTARRAAVDGYRVAGKTGTAKKSSGRRGYTGHKYQAVFAGMAPASKPRFVMVVMIDEPRGKYYYGGLVAAPTFAKVMQAALRLYNVPPDKADATLLLAGGDDS